MERGHRTPTVLRKGGKLVTMPLAPRVARAVDLAVGERVEADLLDPTTNGSIGTPPGGSCAVSLAVPESANGSDHTRCVTPSSPPPPFRRRRAVARRARSSQSRRPAHDDALRPWPPIIGPSRHLHRRHVHRRRRPLTTNTPAFGSMHGRAPDAGTQPPTRPQRPGQSIAPSIGRDEQPRIVRAQAPYPALCRGSSAPRVTCSAAMDPSDWGCRRCQPAIER